MISAAIPPQDAAPAAGRLRDFADRWPPMVVRELRQGLRARGFVVPFLILHGLVLVAVALEFLATRSTDGGGGGWAGSFSTRGPGLFWVSVYLMVGVVMPLRLMESLRAETRESNVELLLLGGLSRWQIVRGKWLVQAVLSVLALLSLLPYMLARYFFGGVELVQNAFSFVSVLALALSLSGCVIGASGYAGLGMRFFLIFTSGFILGMAATFMEGMISMMAFRARVTDLLVFGYGLAYVLLVHGIYTMIGLQLARGHLKLFFLPWQGKPTTGMATLIFIAPFIMVVGAFLMWGAILVPGLILISLLVADRPGSPGQRSAD